MSLFTRLILPLIFSFPAVSFGAFDTNPLKSVLVFLAHPDDETWCSGTLAKLAKQGTDIHVVYATSGGRGKDRSGQHRQGDVLAREREQESTRALKALGLPNPPTFLRMQDRELSEDVKSLAQTVHDLLEVHTPSAVFTFQADGITGHKDHKLVSQVISTSLKRPPNQVKLFWFAVSQSRASHLERLSHQFHNPYVVKYPVADENIHFKVNVANESQRRIEAFYQYQTQFPTSLQNLWKAFVSESVYEDWIAIR